MRFFNYIFIVVLISQLKKTFQHEESGAEYIPIDDDLRAVKLFRNDALYLVEAAVKPFVDNTLLMAQGVACFPIIKNDKNLPIFNLILASMSIAWEYPYSFQDMVRDVAEGRKAVSSLPKTLMNNIKTIVRVCLSSESEFELKSLDASYNYLFDFQPEPNMFIKLDCFQWDFKAANYCYELLIGIDFEPNRLFFEKYLQAFSIISRKMKREMDKIEEDIEMVLKKEDFTEESDQLMNIVYDIETSKLQITPNDHSRMAEYEKFSNLMKLRNDLKFDQKIQIPMQKAIMFIKIVGFIYAVNGIKWTADFIDKVIHCVKTC